MKNGANLRASAVCTIAQVKLDDLLGVRAVDVEAEVLLLDFFVLAVGTDGIDCGVDALGVGGVALAYGDADAVTEVLHVGERWANEGKALAGVGFRKPSSSKVASATVPSRRPAATSR